MYNFIKDVNPVHLAPAATVAKWEGSVFVNIATMHPKQKGASFEAIVRDLLQAVGREVTKPENVQHDLISDGVKIEVKGSCLNNGINKFSFLQLRPEDDYAKIAFLCIRPDAITCWVMEKDDLLKGIAKGHIKPQHGGKRGDGKTFCLYATETELEELGATPILLR